MTPRSLAAILRVVTLLRSNIMPDLSAMDTAATANVALVLATHLMATLLKHGKIAPKEMDEIFQSARSRYAKPLAAPPLQDWLTQTQAILAMAHNDVLQFSK